MDTQNNQTPQQWDANLIPEQGIKIQNIVVRPIIRQSQDIRKWRDALKAAEMIMGRRVMLYDLYDEILLDGVAKDLIDKRILGVTKNELIYVDRNGEEDENTSNLMKSSNGRRLRKEVQYQKACGITLVEMGKNDDDSLHIYVIPRKHILPKIGKVVWEQYGYDGYNYREGNFARTVLEVGKYDDLGYILQVCPYVIYKRGGFGDWAQYAQIFGMPFRKGTYDGYNEIARIQLEQALEKAGSAAYAVIPEGSNIEFLEQKGTQGSANLYDMLRKACNEEMSITVLGQSATTIKQAGAMNSNDETHEQTEDDINEDDRADELAVFNEKVKPILINLGFNLDPNGKFIHKPEEEKTDPTEFATVADIVKNKLKMPIDDDQIYEATGLNKPKDYDAQKAKIAEQQANALQNQNNAENGQQNYEQGPLNDKKKKDKKKDIKQKEKLSALDKIRLSILERFFDHAPEN